MIVGRSTLAGAACTAALALCACHGLGSQSSLPSPGQGAEALRSQAVAAAGIAFEPIGPRNMSDGLPTSGKVNAFAVDPNNPKVMYMASGRGTALETYSSAGIFRTSNGGASWQAANTGVTDQAGAISSVVNALWIDPKNPSVLLAATEYDGLFRTVNGGASWHSVYRTSQATQIVAFGTSLFATSAAGILASNDDGVTWSVQLPASAQEHPTAFGSAQGSAGSALYAGMSDGTIFAFAKGAWSKAGKLPFTTHTGTDGSSPEVHQMAVDPLKPSTIYASENDGVWDQDLFGSTDGGRSWFEVLRNEYGNLGLGTQAIAFSVVHPHRLYLGTDGGFYYVATDGTPSPGVFQAAALSVIDIRDIWTTANPSAKDDACVVASDQGLTYDTNCSIPSRVPTDTVLSASVATGLARRFTVSPDGKTLLVSLQDFDSHYTTNGGASWQINAAGLYEDGFNELAPGNPSKCYAFDEAVGLSISYDGCVNFQAPQGVGGQIFPSRLMTTPIAFDLQNPKTMYLASGPIVGAGFPSAPQAVFRSTDGGSTLQRMNWPVDQPGAVIVDPRNASHILVGALNKGTASSISVTFDAGKTWTRSSGVPATPFWYAITVSPANGQTVLASSVDSSNNVFVLRSSDGGKTFARVSTVVNAPLLRGRAELERHLLGRGAQTDREAGEDEAAASHPAAFVYSPERQIAYNQDVTKGTPDVAITTLRGAFLSTDDGTSWRRLDAALVSHSFWGIRWNKGYLYLGSDGQGVVKSTAPVQLPAR